ncbi:MAG TPA: metallophosphatase family protein, partial [Burkholderiaceae bacterium]|nr:metallophosphatase family protein [Burkholderiaceae bacterium]
MHFANETLEEVGRCTVFAVDWVTSQADIACAVISGDSTDHALDVHAPAVTALAREVRRLSQHCPVLMLQGTFSHEPPGTLNVFALLGGKYRVFVADRICQVALLAGGSWVSSSGWRFEEIPAGTRVVFSCLPSVNKGAVAAAAGAERADAAVGEQVAALLRGFSVANAQARSRGIPTVCISHGTVNGCYTEHGVPMAGLDHEFATGSLFDAGASAFMLGHIHKHQQWHDGGRKVAYPGSIGRLHFGEHGEKGFLDWRIGADAAEL